MHGKTVIFVCTFAYSAQILIKDKTKLNLYWIALSVLNYSDNLTVLQNWQFSVSFSKGNIVKQTVINFKSPRQKGKRKENDIFFLSDIKLPCLITMFLLFVSLL